MLDAVDKVASTAFGDDCGENLVQSPWTQSRFANGGDTSSTYLARRLLARGMTTI
jgi:hypothetical protein